MVVAGPLPGMKAPTAPPNSWAAEPSHDVAIWPISMAAGAHWTLPAAKPGTNRVLYFFEGEQLHVAGQAVGTSGIVLRADAEVNLENGSAPAELLLLQGKPIGEPVAQYGPFVMNTEPEIRQAFADYQRTQFGGWPWPSSGPVHPREAGRFAKHADGRVEERSGT
jgi:quercetin 2,3-dioxygenase